MILTTPTPNGYTFNLRDQMIAVGTYGNGQFTLLESDDTVTTYENGMQALGYLRTKHTPEFYKTPVRKGLLPEGKSKVNNLEKYAKNKILEGVNPLAVE